jgi:hypothetical protein
MLTKEHILTAVYVCVLMAFTYVICETLSGHTQTNSSSNYPAIFTYRQRVTFPHRYPWTFQYHYFYVEPVVEIDGVVHLVI